MGPNLFRRYEEANLAKIPDMSSVILNCIAMSVNEKYYKDSIAPKLTASNNLSNPFKIIKASV